MHYKKEKKYYNTVCIYLLQLLLNKIIPKILQQVRASFEVLVFSCQGIEFSVVIRVYN